MLNFSLETLKIMLNYLFKLNCKYLLEGARKNIQRFYGNLNLTRNGCTKSLLRRHLFKIENLLFKHVCVQSLISHHESHDANADLKSKIAAQNINNQCLTTETTNSIHHKNSYVNKLIENNVTALKDDLIERRNLLEINRKVFDKFEKEVECIKILNKIKIDSDEGSSRSKKLDSPNYDLKNNFSKESELKIDILKNINSNKLMKDKSKDSISIFETSERIAFKLHQEERLLRSKGLKRVKKKRSFVNNQNCVKSIQQQPGNNLIEKPEVNVNKQILYSSVAETCALTQEANHHQNVTNQNCVKSIQKQPGNNLKEKPEVNVNKQILHPSVAETCALTQEANHHHNVTKQNCVKSIQKQPGNNLIEKPEVNVNKQILHPSVAETCALTQEANHHQNVTKQNCVKSIQKQPGNNLKEKPEVNVNKQILHPSVAETCALTQQANHHQNVTKQNCVKSIQKQPGNNLKEKPEVNVNKQILYSSVAETCALTQEANHHQNVTNQNCVKSIQKQPGNNLKEKPEVNVNKQILHPPVAETCALTQEANHHQNITNQNFVKSIQKQPGNILIEKPEINVNKQILHPSVAETCALTQEANHHQNVTNQNCVKSIQKQPGNNLKEQPEVNVNKQILHPPVAETCALTQEANHHQNVTNQNCVKSIQKQPGNNLIEKPKVNVNKQILHPSVAETCALTQEANHHQNVTKQNCVKSMQKQPDNNLPAKPEVNVNKQILYPLVAETCALTQEAIQYLKDLKVSFLTKLETNDTETSLKIIPTIPENDLDRTLKENSAKSILKETELPNYTKMDVKCLQNNFYYKEYNRIDPSDVSQNVSKTNSLLQVEDATMKLPTSNEQEAQVSTKLIRIIIKLPEIKFNRTSSNDKPIGRDSRNFEIPQKATNFKTGDLSPDNKGPVSLQPQNTQHDNLLSKIPFIIVTPSIPESAETNVVLQKNKKIEPKIRFNDIPQNLMNGQTFLPSSKNNLVPIIIQSQNTENFVFHIKQHNCRQIMSPINSLPQNYLEQLIKKRRNKSNLSGSVEFESKELESPSQKPLSNDPTNLFSINPEPNALSKILTNNLLRNCEEDKVDEEISMKLNLSSFHEATLSLNPSPQNYSNRLVQGNQIEFNSLSLKSTESANKLSKQAKSHLPSVEYKSTALANIAAPRIPINELPVKAEKIESVKQAKIEKNAPLLNFKFAELENVPLKYSINGLLENFKNENMFKENLLKTSNFQQITLPNIQLNNESQIQAVEEIPLTFLNRENVQNEQKPDLKLMKHTITLPKIPINSPSQSADEILPEIYFEDVSENLRGNSANKIVKEASELNACHQSDLKPTNLLITLPKIPVNSVLESVEKTAAKFCQENLKSSAESNVVASELVEPEPMSMLNKSQNNNDHEAVQGNELKAILNSINNVQHNIELLTRSSSTVIQNPTNENKQIRLPIMLPKIQFNNTSEMKINEISRDVGEASQTLSDSELKSTTYAGDIDFLEMPKSKFTNLDDVLDRHLIDLANTEIKLTSSDIALSTTKLQSDVVSSQRNPGGKYLYNQSPTHLSKPEKSILPLNTMWHMQPNVSPLFLPMKNPQKRRDLKYLNSEAKTNSKYRFETKEIKSLTGKKIKITNLIFNDTHAR